MQAPRRSSPRSTCSCTKERSRSCRFRRGEACLAPTYSDPSALPRRVLAKIFGIARALLPRRVAAPFKVAARHVCAVAYAEEKRAGGSVGVFVQLARRMHHEGARHDVDRLTRRAHPAAALEAKVNLGRMRMAVVGTD